MNAKVLTKETHPEFRERFEALSPDAAPAWGEMDAVRMLRHLRFMFEMSLGDVEEKDQSIPVLREAFWILTFYLFTDWPKGKLKAPKSFTPPADEDFDREREIFFEKMKQFVDAVAKDPARKELTPLFGPITMTRWQRLHGVHMRHHMKQFGLV